MSAKENKTTNPAASIAVLLADPHAVCRAGLRAMIEDSEFCIAHETETGRQTIEAAQRLQPAAVLLDVQFPDGDGLDVLRAIKARYPQLPVVILTTRDTPVCVAGAIAGGAAGYLRKDIERANLLAALRAVVRGETLFASDALACALSQIAAENEQAPGLIAPLSRRETEVLRLLSSGLANAEIARLLGIAESTVKTHVEHLVRKLGVSGRLQAAVWAARHGLDLNQ